MKRVFLNSEIFFAFGFNSEDIANIFYDKYVIQVESMPSGLIFEYCNNSDILDLIPFVESNMQEMAKNQPRGDINKVNKYRDVIINKDPFMVYTDCPIGKVFDDKNVKWISRCLKEMKNEYIKDRVEYLVDYYKSRGETWTNSIC